MGDQQVTATATPSSSFAAALICHQEQEQQRVISLFLTSSSVTPSMAKIQPLPLPASSSSPTCSPTGRDESQSLQKQAVYTVWMKSLVFNGNGCTVYGADGGVAFRVDNYGCRGGREVFFMDRAGKTLIRIRRKSFAMFRRWEACRYVDAGEGSGEERTQPWFTVQKARGGGAAVTMHGSGRTYTIDGCAGKSEYKITGADNGAVVAAVGRKQTASGVVLGEDVLTLTVGSPGRRWIICSSWEWWSSVASGTVACDG